MYVIIVETGEYSDREDWIGGIFDDEAEAKKIVETESAKVRQYVNTYEKWLEKRRSIVESMGYKNKIFPKHLYQELDNRSAPYPPHKRDELEKRFYIVEVPINVWGNYPYT